MIILTKGEAAIIQGVSIKGHALRPLELVDGTFALPDEVLQDPYHAKHLSTLQLKPRKEVSLVEWVHDVDGTKTIDEEIPKEIEVPKEAEPTFRSLNNDVRTGSRNI